MKENKKELEESLLGIEHLLEQSTARKNDLLKEKQETEKILEDMCKPKITEKAIGLIEARIDYAIEHYDFSDSDNYEFELEINYDNTISLNHIELNDRESLVEAILESVMESFNVIKTDENTESDFQSSLNQLI